MVLMILEKDIDNLYNSSVSFRQKILMIFLALPFSFFIYQHSLFALYKGDYKAIVFQLDFH